MTKIIQKICALESLTLAGLMVEAEDTETTMAMYYNRLLNEGWQFHVVDQDRGRCYGVSKIITVPKWAMRRTQDYIYWYISHEMAHAYAGIEAKHGPQFMKWLQRICPAKSVHYELTYKPKNAMAAGIAPEDF